MIIHASMKIFVFVSLLITSTLHSTITKDKFSTETINRWNQFHQEIVQVAQNKNINLSTGMGAIIMQMHNDGAENILQDQHAMNLANLLLEAWQNTGKSGDIITLVQKNLRLAHNEKLIIPEATNNIMASNIAMISMNQKLNPLFCSPYLKASMIVYAYLKQLDESNLLVRFLLRSDWGAELLRKFNIL